MQENENQTVVIADYDYGNVDIERAIVEGAGFKLVAAQCKGQDDVIDIARDAHAIIAQYAHVGAKAIPVEPDVNLALAPTEDEHLAHAVHAFDLSPNARLMASSRLKPIAVAPPERL